MDAIIAIFSILYIFWPLIFLFGLGALLLQDLPMQARIRKTFNRFFFAWVLWAIFLGMIYWHGRQPIFLLPEKLNHLLFFSSGVIFGGVSIGWMVYRQRKRWIRLSNAQKLEDLLALSPEEFETLIAALFTSYGHKAEVSGGNSDHGVDVIVTSEHDEKWIVQCKRYSGSVGEPIVRDLYGTLQHEEASQAYLITTGSFTARAVSWAEGKPIVLYDGDALVKLIRRTQKRTPNIKR